MINFITMLLVNQIKIPLLILHSICALITLSPLKSLGQIINDQRPYFSGFGIRPTIKHVNIFYQKHIGSNTSLLVESGFEFRYIQNYERFSSLQLGVYPVLASQGFMLETGVIKHLAKTDFLLSLQYKFNHIKEGTDVTWGISDGRLESTYFRDDHKATLKFIWQFYPLKRFQLYSGFGLRGVKSYSWPITYDRDYHSNFTDIKYWIAPTLHFGLRVFVFKKETY